MELDKAQQIGACFNCSKKGHIVKFCPEPKKVVVQGVSTEIDDKPCESPVLDITLLHNLFSKDFLCNMDMVATDMDNYVENGITYTIDNHQSISFLFLPHVKNL